MANVSALTTYQVNRIQTAVASETAGNDIASAINNGTSASAALTGFTFQVAGAIIAAHTSTTTDFAALVVGDIVVAHPVPAGTPANTTGSYFGTVITAGTLPFAAAVVGDLYVVLRAFSYAQPTPTTVVL